MPIETLINKQDTFEIVRDKIAQILADESAAQQALASGQALDPTLWQLNVYTERANPWEANLNELDLTPIVNVWFESDAFDMSRGNVVNRQEASGTFNIDCYGFATSSDIDGGGHAAGDEEAAKEAHRAARLARNIVMSAIYTYLDLRGLVGQRWLSARTSFQPQQDIRPLVHAQAVRLAMAVRYNELSPQVLPVEMECMHTELKRASDGRVMAEAEFGQGCVTNIGRGALLLGALTGVGAGTVEIPTAVVGNGMALLGPLVGEGSGTAASLGFTRMLMTGDSTTRGYGSNGSPRADARVNSLPQKLSAYMNSNGVPSSAKSMYGLGGDTYSQVLAYDPRITSFGDFGANTIDMLGGGAIEGGSGVSSSMIVDIASFDTIALTAFTYPGGGTVQVSVYDGATLTSIGSFSTNAALGLKREVFTIPAGTDDYELQLLPSGYTYFNGFEAWDSTADALAIIPAGWNNQYSADYATSNGLYDPQDVAAFIDTEVLIVNQGINDISGGVNSATFIANYETYIDAVLAVNPDILLFFQIPNDINAGLGHIPASITTLAATYSATILDSRNAADMGTYNSAQIAGKMFDSLHPNGDGYQAIADYFGPIIKGVLYP